MQFYLRLLRAGPFIYKALIYGISVALIVYLFPVEKSFHYTYSPGRPWQYSDLYAPYDFVVKYSPEILHKKQDSVSLQAPAVLTETSASATREEEGAAFLKNLLRNDSLRIVTEEFYSVWKNSRRKGTVEGLPKHRNPRRFYVRKGKKLYPLSEPPVPNSRYRHALNIWLDKLPPDLRQQAEILFAVPPGKHYAADSLYTAKLEQRERENFNPHRRIIYKGQRIISKGAVVSPQHYEILETLKKTSFARQQYKTVKKTGFAVAVATLLLLLMIFFKEFETSVYENNPELSAVFLLIVLTTAVYFTVLQYIPQYVYMVPLLLIPFILKSFFNWRVALTVSLTIILIVSFAAERPFEFALLQSAAILAAITASNDLTHRSNMFLSAVKIVVIYIVTYIAYQWFVTGNWYEMHTPYFLHFAVNGFLSAALVHEIILLFEKLFGITSDISLLELLNTDNKLLKKLAEKAPGTFQHSLQVANLAESLANELNANSLLVRVGALYHDLGKMKNPRYFTENQTGDFNPHEELDPEKSARIIINHVIDGIEMARRNGLPEKVIDFIRTHHGTDTVQYFLEKAKQHNPDIDETRFRYPGPNPFSKETAIVMLADSVEAASKSLKNPTREQLDNLVDKIIDRKLRLGLLNNAEITLKEIEEAKKVLKKKLRSIYHPRVEYPDEVFDTKREKS